MSSSPLVLLAGWLGCQRKSLRRYEEFYLRAGYQVQVEIASPLLVAREILQDDAMHIPSDWPHTQVQSEPDSMEQLAWTILEQIYHSNSSSFIVHVFSNGGCLLWRWIRRMLELPLLLDSAMLTPTTFRALVLLRDQFAGIVFDSCPSSTFLGFRQALQHCAWRDRMAVYRRYGWKLLQLGFGEHRQEAIERAEDFIRFLRDDSWISRRIPQLYLYSKDDPLARWQDIAAIVKHRQRLLGSAIIVERTWERSGHCVHLLRHPEEYKEAISTFLERCRSPIPQSRL